ncbi:MAG: hypothetical protein A3B70_04300 [Deltaproteobacteria bacterium RIFCSPHIGHO2_02_FULL_40_11]|nr:MAG: hypothetical protein A3B70_04300 [Deltaproteobacteria bacterium RIFCSPHIGHO2_02_FULL_40_11]
MRPLLFILYFSLVSMPALYANACETLLDAPGAVILNAEPVILSPQGEGSHTSSFITYLSRLLDARLIGDEHLVRFSEGLEDGKVVNPISEVEATDFKLSVQRSGLEYLIQSGGFDSDVLLYWAREKLFERGVVRVQRKEVHTKTQIPIQLMEFQEIPAGEFWMGEEGKKRKVRIEKPYEMARFQLTQWQWTKVVGENPSEFIYGPESIEVEIDGKKIRMQPNHPVEKIAWDDVHDLFLPKLNALSNKDDSLIYEVIPDHIQGALYDLPTEEQWERAARAGTDTVYSFGDDEAELPKYAWFSKNANGSTHVVGLKLPNAFGLFDMHGNVQEWVKDKSGSDHVVRGGGWHLNAKPLRSAGRGSWGADSCGNYVGFRPLRTNP